MTTEPRERKEILRDIVRGVTKVIENAEHLAHEAALLRAAGAFSRALFLHQISIEECAKIDMLGAWAISLLMGEEHDAKKFSEALASHKAKNFSNAYMLTPTEAEKRARERSDWKGALDAFKKAQAEFHLESNTGKNAALYVDFQDGLFTAPSERITETMLSNLADRNAEFLGYANYFVRVLSKWQDCADDVEELARWFSARAEQLKTQMPEDPELLLSTLMNEALERLSALPVNKQRSARSSGKPSE